MFLNYFRIAWRNLKRNKLYTIVNLTGLTVGIVCTILIGLYITHEFSYDKFNTNANRTCRVVMEYSYSGMVENFATTGTKVGPAMKRSIPGVEDFTRVYLQTVIIRSGEKKFSEAGFLYADSSIFRIFSFHLLQGDPATALNAPKQVVLTRSMAKKYFGDEDPVGKTILIDNSTNYTITGIVSDPPGNSQIKFQFVASFTSLPAASTEQWWTANYITYLLLRRPDDLPVAQQQISSLMKSSEVRKEARVSGADYLTYHLEPLTSVHLHSSLSGLEPNGSISYIFILGAIALLILAIACVNYTNLATAQSESRRGEISVRKVLGARPAQLFSQYMGESILLTFTALVLSALISIQLLPLFNKLANKSLTADYLLQPLPILALLGLGVLVSLLAGAYPAFILSNLKLINIIRSGFRRSSSGVSLRRSLIVFQFMISVFLMISTMVIFQQLSFIQHKQLGYDKDHIIVLPVDNQMRDKLQNLKDAIARTPEVQRVGGACGTPTFVRWTDGIHSDLSPGKHDVIIKAIPADPEFMGTLNMQLIAGSDFQQSDYAKLDTSDNFKNYRNTFILNESAVKALGWTPETAIGKTIEKGYNGTIKGVVKDFHFSSMHEAIGPLVLFLDNEFINRLYVRVSGNHLPTTLSSLETIWKSRVPDHPFEYHFLDEEYNALYKTETRTGQLFGTFAITAILLACLGLFTLAAFTTAQRTKEIGIRKVLGASLLSLTGLLSGSFLRLVGIAALIAIPFSWWAMNKWLGEFVYRISISWFTLVIPIFLSMLIAMATVSFQALRAGMANPVDSLRSE